jgi:hypothetical protein
MPSQFLELRHSRRNSAWSSPYTLTNIQQAKNNDTVERYAAWRKSLREHSMFTAKQFRAKAAESAESLKLTDVPSEIREFQRSKESFAALAENEDWLANNFDKTIQSQGTPPQNDDAERPVARKTVAENEERILRCLGAAVIMQWNTIPTKLQRELFDTAGSMGDVLQSAELRAQIARFLHKQKDEESPVDSVYKRNMPKGTPHVT